MDFRQANQTPVNRPESSPVAGSAPQHNQKKSRSSDNMPKWLHFFNVVILFSVAVLLALIAFSFARTNNTTENKLVDSNVYQAVFLNNGQVYFGKVVDISGDFLRLTGVYYLTQNNATATDTNTTTNSDYTLVKLGCQQIHYPYDQMVINRSQVTFWENLNKDGQVTKKIDEFKKANPNGPDCTQVTANTQATSDAGTQGSTTDKKQ